MGTTRLVNVLQYERVLRTLTASNTGSVVGRAAVWHPYLSPLATEARIQSFGPRSCRAKRFNEPDAGAQPWPFYASFIVFDLR